LPQQGRHRGPAGPPADTPPHQKALSLQIFESPTGNGRLWFDNLLTIDGIAVAYDPIARQFQTNTRACSNRAELGCNWKASADGPQCVACAMNTIIPDLSVPNARENWAATEAAKRWALDNLHRWGWFGPGDSGIAPQFQLLAEGPTPVTTGHASGVVTISIAEADAVVKVTRQESLEEPYRTMLGHLRHELAHFIWWRLSCIPEFINTFRSVFGDERQDYQSAIMKHHSQGNQDAWKTQFISHYASAHPHEDWAETAAHLLHLTDIADSFAATDLNSPHIPKHDWDPYAESNADTLISTATSITIAINHINRSMGLNDLYPFVLSPAAREKLHLAHSWMHRGPPTITSRS
jgi:hypothetical protein